MDPESAMAIHQRKGQKRKLEEGPSSPAVTSMEVDSGPTLADEIGAQVEVLKSSFSWREADRAAAKRATHVLAELDKNEDVVNAIVEGGAVPALVMHLKEPPAAGERPLEHEVEKGSAFALGLLAVKTWDPENDAAHIAAKDQLSIDVGTSSNDTCQDLALTPFLGCLNSLPSNFGLIRKDLGQCDYHFDKKCDDKQGVGFCKELPKLLRHVSLDFDLNVAISKGATTDIPEMEAEKEQKDLLDTRNDQSLLWIEAMGEDSCIFSAAPLAVKYEEMHTEFFVRNDNLTCKPYIENMVRTAGPEENEIATEKLCQSEEPFVPLSSKPNSSVTHQTMLFEKPEVTMNVVSNVGLNTSFGEVEYRIDGNFPRMELSKREEKGATTKQKTKRTHNINILLKESQKEDPSKEPKSNSDSKVLPKFESFDVEEEEGSGGYGTVYRARRKEDGKILAVKCPHSDAHSHHVHNELKMLERFGGRNFVIKYEGSFRSGNLDCFVLEHVHHERPEVLKKEINKYELKWYGYCMFRALTSLHKHGVVHRDVKPGNFLFSRKLNKGYLIDFNLASDLQQKLSRNSKSETVSDVNVATISMTSSRSAILTQGRSLGNIGASNSFNKEAANNPKKPVLKNVKKGIKEHRDAIPKINALTKFGSQAADSGVTSTKEPTSTRTQSADRLNQPLPCKGRKELLSFVHDTMKNPNHKTVTAPTFQRKRVVAPVAKNNKKLMIVSPMPLISCGNAVAGAGMARPGNGKQKREGPCVGTKGFRAPEVLFKSSYQGCKIDVWSAGVTLLYLIIGKSPFGGDPEQNIKDIATLRGSEDLWEIAKLHDRESSYPTDLFDIQFLKSMDLRDWCEKNTKRPEFLKDIPNSLFDLVDKCLTINPRLRITAEDALMHKFFNECHEELRKQRMLRRVAGSDSGSQTL